jgi:O-antigen ligase
LKRSVSLTWIDPFTRRAASIAWIVFLVCLPVTSFPFFPSNLGGGTLVRPFAVYPLLFLLVFATLPRLIRGVSPRTLLSFVPFLLAAVASILLASLRGIESAQGVSALARMTRALLTLSLGSAFYFTVVLYPRNSKDLDASLRWLYLGLILALIWGTLQAVYVVHYSSPYFHWMNQLQHLVSIRKLFPKRVSGLTYEPNWFAEQISFLYLPWLFAAVLRRKTVFPFRWHFVSIESLLLLWSGIILFFTYSRSGLIILLLFIFISILLFLPGSKKKTDRMQSHPLHENARRFGVAGLIVLGLIVVIFAIGQRNHYFSRIWNYWVKDVKTTNYFEYIAFGQRFVYWETAYHIFSQYPIFGVGLGNYAFYFVDSLPERAFNTIPEILRNVTYSQASGRLVTSKNLFTRLLAETGIVGMATFLAFIVVVCGCTLYLWLSPDNEHKFWGLAGMLGLIAFTLSAFSNDSFSVPNMWIVFGLITAAAHYSTTSRLTRVNQGAG